MGGWEKSDIACLLIAILGIVLWRLTNNPMLALIFSLIADFTGMIPALIKTYKFPETEVWYFYALDTVAAAFTIAAISLWTPKEYIYPLYILGINLIMSVLCLRKSVR